MAVYRLNLADGNLISQITDPEELEKRIPRMGELYNNIAEMRNLQNEISTVGRFVKASGFTPGREMQRIGTVPAAIVSTIAHLDPDFWTDTKKVLQFFNDHPEYDTRGKVY